MEAKDIAAAYKSRREAYPAAAWGWSFMYTRASAAKDAKVALVGLNPGGSEEGESGWDYADPDVGKMNAYVDQPWGKDGQLNNLQRQVRALFAILAVEPAEVFAAQLVPFRSPSWNRLPDRSSALAFGRLLWTESVLGTIPAKLYISLGKVAGREVASLLAAKKSAHGKVGWGKQFWEEFRAPDGRVVLALPHLSRFSLFDRPRKPAVHKVRALADELLANRGTRQCGT